MEVPILELWQAFHNFDHLLRKSAGKAAFSAQERHFGCVKILDTCGSDARMKSLGHRSVRYLRAFKALEDHHSVVMEDILPVGLRDRLLDSPGVGSNV